MSSRRRQKKALERLKRFAGDNPSVLADDILRCCEEECDPKEIVAAMQTRFSNVSYKKLSAAATFAVRSEILIAATLGGVSAWKKALWKACQEVIKG